MLNSLRSAFLFSFLFALPVAAAASKKAPSTSRLKPAAGYSLEVFASDVDDARSLAVSPKGIVFVGTRSDEVYAIRNGQVLTIAKSLHSPNGVAYRDGSLYVAEISRILRFDRIEERIEAMAKDSEKSKKGLDYVVVYKKLPTEGHHGWKFIAFGPDSALYVPVGAPCNTCEEKDPRFASILRFAKLDGSDPEIYASGIRNTVGFDWHPQTKVLWFTDNGSDRMGDDVPADELNAAPKKGLHFGYPYCHQGNLPDPEYGKKRKCDEFEKPKMLFQAHVAALGIRFLDENTAIYAEHGSWNRSSPVGYRVMKITFQNGNPVKNEPFLDGFRTPSGEVIGRPVDVLPLPDRSILISDDEGTIYRMVPKK